MKVACVMPPPELLRLSQGAVTKQKRRRTAGAPWKLTSLFVNLALFALFAAKHAVYAVRDARDRLVEVSHLQFTKQA